MTLEDLLEEIVGDIEDEFDLPDESVERIDETTIRIDGSFTIDDFNEQFQTELDTDDFHTVAGFVFGHLGRAAEIGDEVSEGRLALPRARDERHADPAARGGVPARPGRRGRHARSRLASARLTLTAPAPRLLALRRGDGRDGRRDRDVVRRDRLAGLRDPRQPARSRARRARDVRPAPAARAARRDTSPTGTRDARSSRSRSVSTRSVALGLARSSPGRARTRPGRSSRSRSAPASRRRSARRRVVR